MEIAFATHCQGAAQAPVAAVGKIVGDVQGLGDADPREGEPLLMPQVSYVFRQSEIQPVSSGPQEIRRKQAGNVGSADRPISVSASRGLHFDQGLKPQEAA